VPGIARGRNHDIYTRIRERPFQQSLRPRFHAELGERFPGYGAAHERSFAERPHDNHRDTQLGGQRQDLLLAFALVRVQRHLHHVEAARPQRTGQLPESARRIVRHTESIDAFLRALLLEP
jgi:hypothetical protein